MKVGWCYQISVFEQLSVISHHFFISYISWDGDKSVIRLIAFRADIISAMGPWLV